MISITKLKMYFEDLPLIRNPSSNNESREQDNFGASNVEIRSRDNHFEQHHPKKSGQYIKFGNQKMFISQSYA
jgi:hypothetical protein